MRPRAQAVPELRRGPVVFGEDVEVLEAALGLDLAPLEGLAAAGPHERARLEVRRPSLELGLDRAARRADPVAAAELAVGRDVRRVEGVPADHEGLVAHRVEHGRQAARLQHEELRRRLRVEEVERAERQRAAEVHGEHGDGARRAVEDGPDHAARRRRALEVLLRRRQSNGPRVEVARRRPVGRVVRPVDVVPVDVRRLRNRVAVGPGLVDEHAALDAVRRQQFAEEHAQVALAAAEVDDRHPLVLLRDEVARRRDDGRALDQFLHEPLLHEPLPQLRVPVVAPAPAHDRVGALVVDAAVDVAARGVSQGLVEPGAERGLAGVRDGLGRCGRDAGARGALLQTACSKTSMRALQAARSPGEHHPDEHGAHRASRSCNGIDDLNTPQPRIAEH